MKPEHKNILRGLSLSLRHLLEGYYDEQDRWHPGDLERRLNEIGIWKDRAPKPLQELHQLSEADLNARRVVEAYIQYRRDSGTSREDAVAEFILECAYTWFNRLFALRCMEAREIIDEVVLQKEAYGWRSLQHNRFTLKYPEKCIGDDEGLFSVLFQEFELRVKELPHLFDPTVPAIALRPSVAVLKKCIALLSGREPVGGHGYLLDEIFEAPSSFGWAYQYWNAEEKNRVFEKVRTEKSKIEGKDIIPVTCIYTEDYMVKFLVQNSLGAMWIGMHHDSRLAPRLKYFVGDADRARVEKKAVTSITFLDPACGSGHFLLEAFDVFFEMYKEEGKFSTSEEICASILNNNLFGIDIDERAVQISIAVLWMKAKQKAPLLEAAVLSDFHKHLTSTNIWLPKDKNHLEYFLNKHPEDRPLISALEAIFEGLKNVRELGSLLRIEELVKEELQNIAGKLGTQRTLVAPKTDQEWETWRHDVLERLKEHVTDEAVSVDTSQFLFSHSVGKGLLLFDLLAQCYDVVATNPPFSGSRTMGSILKEYVNRYYAPGKRDLYTAFILRCLELTRMKGRIAIVTQQSWMFLSSFADLRAIEQERLRRIGGSEFKGMLQDTAIELIAHLGEHAFEDPAAAGAFVALFVFAKTTPSLEHRITAFRLIGPKSSSEKDTLLLTSNKTSSNMIRFACQQRGLLSIPNAPLVYSARENIMKILNSPSRLRDLAFARQGLATSDNNRFVRYFWEVPDARNAEWPSYLKGGKYQKWGGLDWLAIDWRHNGAAVKAKAGDLYGSVTRTIKNQDFYFKPCLTYTLMSRGSLGVRKARPGPFDVGGMCIFSNCMPLEALAALLNSRLVSYLLRIVSQDLKFQCGTVESLPLPPKTKLGQDWEKLGNVAIRLKEWAIAKVEVIERGSELYRARFCEQLWNDDLHAVLAMLHSIEAFCDQKSNDLFALSQDDEMDIFREVGRPAGQMPLIEGYDMLPLLPSGVPELPHEVCDYLARYKRKALAPQQLVDLKKHLRVLYQSGLRAEEETVETDYDVDENGEEGKWEEKGGTAVVGASIPIPTETFLEELSQKLEVHPLSVYWLLKEGIEREAWRRVPMERRVVADRLTVIILRLLGYRWPRQIEEGESIPEWVDADGIIPLTEVAGRPTLLDLVRERIEEDSKGSDMITTEHEFANILGEPFDEWLATEFFKHHTQQFKKRPIAWQIESRSIGSSKRGRRRRKASGSISRPAFSCLVLFHRLDNDFLPKIRNQYIGPLRARYETELRTLENIQTPSADQAERLVSLENLIEELREFDAKLEKVVNNGFDCPELREIVAREPLDKWTAIDCEASSPPTRDLFYTQEKAYSPDLSDGVRVNMAPLQKAGLLAADVLSGDDVDRAISDRAEWRRDDRRWCRDGKLPNPGWWKTKGETI